MTLLDTPPAPARNASRDSSATRPSSTGRATSSGRPPVWRRIVVGLLVALTGVHAAFTFLWIAPSTPLRDVVPDGVLSAYMDPMFDQAWSVFAPEPIDGDYRFSVRATVLGDDGEVSTTGWVEAMSEESALMKGTFFPPRAAIVAHKQSLALYARYEDLSEAQREVVSQGFYQDGWVERLRSDLRGVEGDGNEVTAYLKQEWKAIAYATQIARAMWGDGVQEVQYEVSRRSIIPFELRDDPEAEPNVRIVDTGWRGVVVRAGQNEEAFADVFRSLDPVETERSEGR